MRQRPGLQRKRGRIYGLNWWVDVCGPASSCHPSTNGSGNYCSSSCTCADGEGHCSSDAECDSGLVCNADVGASYGFDWWIDVCGSASSCHPSSLGTWNYCNSACTCAEGEGQCSDDGECDSGLVCQTDAGASYGLNWWIDVCVPE